MAVRGPFKVIVIVPACPTLDLMVQPYLEETKIGRRARVAYSLKVTGVAEPRPQAPASKSTKAA